MLMIDVQYHVSTRERLKGPFVMKPTIYMHVNYCEQGQSIEDICRKAVDWGFDGVEFRRKRFGIEEDHGKYLDALASGVRKSGLRHVSFGAPGVNLMSGDDQQRDAEVNAAATFYIMAHERFGTTIFNTFAGELRNPDAAIPYYDYPRHGSAIATEQQWRWAIDGFKKIAQRIEPLGIRLAFETHMVYLHDLPEPAKKLVDGIGSKAIGVLLDYANIMLFPNMPPLAMIIETLGDRIYYIHLKNLVQLSRIGGGAHFPIGLADGEINHREFLRCLQRIGYAGPLCIEAPRPGDREWFARQDLAYLNALLKDLNWT